MDFNKLWANFLDTVQNHYLDFEGRVGRSQYWYYVLVYVIIAVLVGVVAGIIGLHALQSLYGLALFLPSLGMTARRLHDIGKPTTWVWILAIPFVLELLLGFLTVASVLLFPLFLFFASLTWLVSLLSLVALVVIVYFCAQPGDTGFNQYGPPPPVFSPN
jgi:uncharacterized membrane protein YhaH (DUF805 family)